MQKPLKKKDHNRYADRFHDYLLAHKSQVWRYFIAAVLTALIELFLKELIYPGGGFLIPFAVRFILFFPILKLWVYKERSDLFYTLRQVMIAIMIITFATFIFNYLTIFFVGLWGRAKLISYCCKLALEIIYFALYQFIIFKEKN
ncbi:MAG: hypothetical protein IJN34_00030 [Clostridia bacterium]|nr:hypothetical protein [Clostridia bacterium]